AGPQPDRAGAPPEDPPEHADVETASAAYARRFAGPAGRWLLAVQEAATLALVAPLPGLEALDVGGGHGQLLEPLLRRGYRVTVVGSHRSCLERIRPLVDGVRCRFVVADLLALPFPARAFDVVLGYRLLPHVRRWERLVGELARVAAGAVLVDFPLASGWHRLAPLFFRLKRRLEGNTRPYRRFREAEVAAAFAAHGFRPTGRVGELALPMVLHRVLAAPHLSARLEAVCARAGLAARWGSPVVERFERQE
ncbi:MAG TPA: class I SAM-dependent methyltransferase, partial [Thermodesulfobacteriota bacterium]|nr:class I SAM-dependent methyltransferase [Thermodesulfobacteriota bacterium]